MPELPEVEAARRALSPVMDGARFTAVLARRPDLRIPFPRDFISRLVGETVRAVERRGKYLLATLSSGETLIMHLGMSGSFRVTPGSSAVAAGPHDHVVFQMSSGKTITFNDPRRFGFMTLIE
ncbi:MAG: DNA-formamidopyrimidine glycosylase, partial [Acidobacteria bacterium]|nr:DNA-formamidopyrimidine glycosylase [Acidobacteriota bacterium]